MVVDRFRYPPLRRSLVQTQDLASSSPRTSRDQRQRHRAPLVPHKAIHTKEGRRFESDREISTPKKSAAMTIIRKSTSTLYLNLCINIE